MKGILDHAFSQYLILLIAIIAGIVAMKAGAAYLPADGFGGAVKKVLMAA